MRKELRRIRAFSLVEVVLAIGVVSFAMIAVLGALPVGLKSSQESRGQVTTANIARQLKGELQQLSFDHTSSDGITVENLGDNPFYYSLEGNRSDAGSAYYEAAFSVTNVSVPGQLTIDPANARNITVTLSYPVNVAPANRQHATFSFFLAKQKMD